MSNSEATLFEELWRRTGLAGASNVTAAETIRGPIPQTTHSKLPHLSIGADSDAEQHDAQLIVERLLGEGGMGQVHLARQPLLDREVAIKRVRPGAPEAAARSLFREARTMGSLEHPNILPVHALGADDSGRPILVMKRISGVEWLDLIGDPDHAAWADWAGVSTDALGRNIEVLLDVCRAVHFAHERGVLHLDLKPENAMLGSDGGVTVLDWGIARKLEDDSARGIAGTPAFMAPEMVDPELPLTRGTDVFLLGGCLHLILTGRPPHSGSNLKEVVQAAHEARPPELDGVDEGLAVVCRTALAADPADRYPTVAGLQQALTEWLRTRGSAELTRRAEAATERLSRRIDRENPDPVAIARAWAEARFGFEQALEQWPDNQPARKGLEQARRLMLGFELQRENLDHAKVLAEEIGPDPDIEARIADVEAHVESRKKLERDQDLGVARWERSAFMIVLGITGLVMTVVVLSGWFVDPADMGAFEVMCIGVLYNVVIWILIGIGRNRLLANEVNTRITWAVCACAAGIMFGRISGWIGGATVAMMFAQDLLVMAVTVVIMGIFIRSRLVALGSIPPLVGAFLANIRPEWALYLFGWGTVITMFVAGGVWWFVSRD